MRYINFECEFHAEKFSEDAFWKNSLHRVQYGPGEAQQNAVHVSVEAEYIPASELELEKI